MAQIHLTPGLTLLEAYQVAHDAGMHLICDGREIKVSPIILPGWRAIPLRIKPAAANRGNICTDDRVAA